MHQFVRLSLYGRKCDRVLHDCMFRRILWCPIFFLLWKVALECLLIDFTCIAECGVQFSSLWGCPFKTVVWASQLCWYAEYGCDHGVQYLPCEAVPLNCSVSVSIMLVCRIWMWSWCSIPSLWGCPFITVVWASLLCWYAEYGCGHGVQYLLCEAVPLKL